MLHHLNQQADFEEVASIKRLYLSFHLGLYPKPLFALLDYSHSPYPSLKLLLFITIKLRAFSTYKKDLLQNILP